VTTRLSRNATGEHFSDSSQETQSTAPRGALVDRLAEWARGSGLVLLAPAIFLSAFLLFLVQPLIASYILPWFGGSGAVWTTAVLFFQLALVGGYAYAHLSVSLLSGRAQAGLHAALLLIAVAMMPITPAASWNPPDAANPSWPMGTPLAEIGEVRYTVSRDTAKVSALRR
jgi:hypothetical protein